MSAEFPRRDKDEAARLAKVLGDLSPRGKPIPELTVADEGELCSDEGQSSYIDLANRQYAQRRRRAAIFDTAPGMLTDPAWDILLLLFIAHERGHPVQSKAIFIEREFNARLAQRWLQALEHSGLVRTWIDERDREELVALTPAGTLKMLQYLSGVSAKD